MERYKYALILLIVIPVFSYAFSPVPSNIYGVSFKNAPVNIPSLVKFNVVSRNVDVGKGRYDFTFDNGKNEIINFRSKYNRIYYISRYIGIYDRINYHFKVRNFINCFKKLYGPPDKDNSGFAANMPEMYKERIMQWESGKITMRLRTLYYIARPMAKYVPGIDGKDIIVEYLHKDNSNFIYGMDFGLDNGNRCRGVW